MPENKCKSETGELYAYVIIYQNNIVYLIDTI
jgi:hypothetical protein